MDVPFRVVVLGGGTAGWIAAARIAAATHRRGEPVSVCLVESPTSGPIGVGEGTWPTIRNTLSAIGIAEDAFLQATDGAFKQGARFVGWATGAPTDAYYHPLNPPGGGEPVDFGTAWAADAAVGERASFASCVDFQAALCDAGRAPKPVTAPPFSGPANYAYHLDAVKFADLLRAHATGMLGVQHLRDDVIEVRQAEDGDITSLRGIRHDVIAGDLFVDCSGLSGRLIGGVYGSALRSCRDILFADRAVALQLPYDDDDAPVVPYTVATAQDAGWIWDIGLWTRRGIGHVYSSDHIDDDAAERSLRRYAGPGADRLEARRLRINAGYRRTFWENNCVAVGLAGGFIEPLEASSIVLAEVAVDMLAERLPRTRAARAQAARQFNRTFEHHWRRVVEFLKLHYAISKRTDTAFWRDNTDPRSFPDELAERLTLWRHHPPSAADFGAAREVFSWPSYQYVLYGMGFPTDYGAARNSADAVRARRAMERMRMLSARAVAELPDHRALLAQVRRHGMAAA